MLLTISQYAGGSTRVGFLLLKQAVIGNVLWRTVFYVHVFTCFVCLFAGLTQFSKWLLKERPGLHRLLGKIYAFNIIFINVPMGLVLALYANGGLPGKLAFTTLDILWLFSTLLAIVWIRRGDVQKHGEYMIRSYALTLSALTLRLWKLVFVHLTSLDLSTIYIVDAWLGFTLNLLIAEIIIRKSRLSLQHDIARNYPVRECNEQQE